MADIQDDSIKVRTTWRDALAVPFGAIKRRLSEVMRRSALREEIAAFDRAGTLDTLLDDLGLTRWEMNQIVRQYPEAEHLLPTMAYHLGIDLSTIDPHSLYDLRHTCSLCESHRECRHFLAEGQTAHADFCPNKKLFDSLRPGAKANRA